MTTKQIVANLIDLSSAIESAISARADAKENRDAAAEETANESIDQIVLAAREGLEEIGSNVSDARVITLIRAAVTGLTPAQLKTIASAARVAKGDTIVLPTGKYDHLSRGKGWCRRGKGDSATWGQSVNGGGWKVGPGKWTVGSSDGFSRKEQVEWDVKNVGGWTIAN